MKKRVLIIVIAIVVAVLLIGGGITTFAVINNQKQGQGGGHPQPKDDEITLSWGENSLVNIDDLSIGEEKGPYKVELVAQTEAKEDFIGKLTVTLSSTVPNTSYSLLDYVYVNVYDTDTKDNLLLTINENSSEKQKTVDVDLDKQNSKNVYFFVGLSDSLTPYVLEKINDEVTMTIDWGK